MLNILIDVEGLVNNMIDKKNAWILKLYKWRVCPNGYLRRKSNGNVYFLHHYIIGQPINGMVVDHKNGNKLDNRCENLHIVSPSYNNVNRPKQKTSKQKYKGINKLKSGRYQARSTGKNLGVYNTAKDAFAVYRKYSEQKYGKLYAI